MHIWGGIRDIEETCDCKVTFPIIADHDKAIAGKYGMIHSSAEANFTIRSVFIIGPDKKIRLILTYPIAVGRNFDEILRVIDALQLNEQRDIVVPANWKNGDKVIIDPALSNSEIKTKYPKGYQEVKPYLRYVTQPEK